MSKQSLAEFTPGEGAHGQSVVIIARESILPCFFRWIDFPYGQPPWLLAVGLARPGRDSNPHSKRPNHFFLAVLPLDYQAIAVSPASHPCWQLSAD